MNKVKAFYDRYLRRWVKAIAAAVGGAAAGLFINWVNGTTPIPHSKEDWVTLLVATFGPPLLALLAPANKITQKQLDADPNVAPGAVTVDNAGEGTGANKPQVGTAHLDVGITVDGAPPEQRKSSWK